MTGDWKHNQKRYCKEGRRPDTAIHAGYGLLRRILLAITVASCLAMPVVAYAQCAVPTEGLVGHWKLDESGNVSTAADSISGNNGNLNNFPADPTPNWQDGKIDNTLAFDGNDDFVRIPDSNLWDFAGKQVTVSVWFKAAATQNDGWPRFLDHFTGSTFDGWRFGLDSAGEKLEFQQQGTDSATINSTLNYNDDQWHHAVVTLDGATARLYVDGILDNTDGYATLEDHDKDLDIGGQSTSNNFNGQIDDVRVYDRALSADEVGALYALRSNDDAPAGFMTYDTRHEGMMYCNGTDWVHAGIGSYNPNGIHDNSSYLSGTDLTGVSDTKKLTASFWINPDNPTLTVTTEYFGLEAAGSNRFVIGNDTTGTFELYGRDNTATEIVRIANGSLKSDAWHHMLVSIDTGTSTLQLYMDDAPLTGATVTADGVLDLNNVDLVEFFNGSVDGMKFADFWIDFGTYIDLSVEANRRKFISDNGLPMYLGADGSLPLGQQPDIFLSGNTANWHTNKGAGGGFAENGALITASSQPGDSVIPDTIGDIESGLLGYWPMNDTSGTTVFSYSGEEGTFAGEAAVVSAAGKIDSALVFDGTDDIVTVPNSSALEDLTQLTLSAWIYPTAGGGSSASRIISKSDGGTGDDYTISMRDNETIEFRITAGGSSIDLEGSTVLSLDTWSHVTGTWDGSSMRLFINGVEDSASPIAKSGVIAKSGRPLAMGSHLDSAANRRFTGRIDEARIYDRALSESEVELLFSTMCPPGAVRYDPGFNVMTYCNGAEWVPMGPVGGGVPMSGLEAWYKFDESSGTTAPDSSGNGRDATLVGGLETGWLPNGGKAGGALAFSDTDGQAVNTNFASVNTSQAFTYAAWIKPAPDEFGALFGQNNTQQPLVELRGDYVRFIDSGAGTVDTPQITQPDTWHHFTAVYMGPSADEMIWYVDGVEVFRNSSLSGNTSDSTTNDLYIGNKSGLADPFDGVMDEAMIYSRALSATEVSQLYYYGLSGGLGDVSGNCSNPSGVEGMMVYNSTHNVMQYCNGENWIGIGQ